ncbi:glycosyltransferase [Affinibrenneria salicis]|uniref:Glycosyltransferase n=1 Tax=Affinibrenneria salicis TaxID=2590031 RepID=A0A5J5FTB7_9GAMM|nr:glycosyltransferase [Affinibrenneria salicis]KAA8996732.1 glycosyltransferase [Affinibrenneria salicis]
MTASPLVSIIILAANARYLEQTLSSACQQDIDNLQIIVCDSTTDNLVENIVVRLNNTSRHDIHYQRNAGSADGADSLQQALQRAQGQYIKLLSDCDVLREDHTRRLVAAMQSAPDIVLASSRRRRIDGEGQVLKDIMATAWPFAGDQLIDGRSLNHFLARAVLNFVGELSCVLFRRADLLALAPAWFRIDGREIASIADLVLYSQLLRQGNLIMLADALTDKRTGDDQANTSFTAQAEEEYRLYQTQLRKWQDSDAQAVEDGHIQIADPAQPDVLTAFNLHQALLQSQERGKEIKSTAEWLAQRVPTASESRMITDYLAQHATGRELALVIIDNDGDEDKLLATLDSITAAQHPGVKLLRIILTSTDLAVDRYDCEDVRRRMQQPLAVAVNQIAGDYAFDWLMLVQAGETFTAGGLLMTSLGLVSAQECAAVYGDQLLRGADNQLGASCRPDFNLDYLLSLPAVMTRHWLFNRNVLQELGGFDAEFDDAPEFEFIVRLIEEKGIGAIGHLAEFLIITDSLSLRSTADEARVLARHLQRRGYAQGEVLSPLPGHYRLRYGHQQQPLVSIIIPTKDQLPVLIACVTSLLEKTRYRNYELLIVDNNSETPEAQAWLAGVAQVDPGRIRVLRYPHPFNYSSINNMAAGEARGDYLLLLNNDTAIIQEDWLDNLLNHAQRPEVGIVGAKLVYPDRRIQHGGVILGLRGPAEHPFNGDPMDASGYMQRLQVDQNYSVVTAACLLIRKSVYQQVGGLDEQAFKVSYNDVDLCLKVREAGYLTVWTPYAVVMHEGSVSQKKVDTAVAEAKRQRFIREQDAMYQKWLPVIARDPAYNANLSLCGRGFELEVDAELSWRPLSWRPLPVVMAHFADQAGCGHYRVMKPFNALKDAGLIDGKLSNVYLSLPVMTRYAPDVLILQRQISTYFHDWVERLGRFSQAFKVYELDDYLPNVPLKSVHRANVPKDVVRLMRKSLGFMDRFVVSTAPLAEAFADLHTDIRVVENRLPIQWWGNVQGLRRQGKKPRVGWGGGSSHTGDLELITDIVRDLADEVEWVFFGMCPEKLRPYVHEFHRGVEIDLYPAKLASLNLDLALAPLEDNLFNRCKSNLRLLEYGACGFPVICTDLDPYQGDLPVTRVRNRYKDWMDAIRMHLADLDATAQMGDALQTAVKRDWMLTGDNLDLWRKAWLPD